MHSIKTNLRSNITTFILLIVLFGTVDAQSLIESGPMLGYSSSREVGIWLKTSVAAEVKICYSEVEGSAENCTNVLHSEDESRNIVKFIIGDLPAGKIFNYRVYINGSEIPFSYKPTFQTLPIWKYRNDAPDFSFVAGSCNYVSEEAYDRPGKPYGGEYQIFEHIAEEKADFMVWLGDNTYLREADWDSESGIYYRYQHTRALPDVQKLLSNTHHYAIWDDHDYGPNDSEGSFYLKNVTKKAFSDFWMNPVQGVGSTEGISSFFSWLDCDFFLLDNRWYRTPEDSKNPVILGQKQVDWLIDALSQSHAQFKFVCVGGQFLSDAQIFENHANYPAERNYILSEIDRLEIDNVIFLTGDRHHSEISKYETKSGRNIYEITSSPLTSGAYDHSHEPNHYRVPDSMVGQRNYALIDVVGSKAERTVIVTLKDNKGNDLFRYEIPAKD